MTADDLPVKPTIKDLLERAKLRRGVTSGRALADLTHGHEFSIDRTQVNHLLRETYHHRLTARSVRAIAWLAQVDEGVAFQAAGRPEPGPPFAKELPPDADYLSSEDRQAVILLIRRLLGSSRAMDSEDPDVAAVLTEVHVGRKRTKKHARPKTLPNTDVADQPMS